MLKNDDRFGPEAMYEIQSAVCDFMMDVMSEAAKLAREKEHPVVTREDVENAVLTARRS